jgi:hypothetical protein
MMDFDELEIDLTERIRHRTSIFYARSCFVRVFEVGTTLQEYQNWRPTGLGGKIETAARML